MAFRIKRRGPCSARTLAALSIAALLVLLPARAGADGGAFTVRETGVHIAGGVNPSSFVEYYALHGHVGISLWDSIDRWFHERNMTARWIIEPWVALVSDNHGLHQTDSFEIGVNALFARVTFGERAFRPFVEGRGHPTDLRKQDYGTRIQFSSQIGVGLEYRFDPTSLSRSRASAPHLEWGLASSNPGVNTIRPGRLHLK
jgi:hypothetical protein